MATVDASIPLSVQSPTIQGAMSNMSALLGVKQQQQALQQSTIKTQQDQNMLQEQQALGALNPRDYIDPNTGIIDADRYMQDAMAATPRTGLGVQRATQVYGAQKAQTEVAQAGQNLNLDIRQQVASRMNAVKSDPNATYKDYVVAAQQIKDDNPKAAPLVDSYLKQLSPDDPIATTHAKTNALTWAVLPPKDQLPSTTAIDTGPTIQGGTQESAMTGGGITTAGQPVRKGLAPTQQLPYVRAQAAESTAGAAGARSDEELYNQIRDAATKSSQIRSLAKDVADLSDVTQTGPLTGGMAQKWSTLKNTLGFASAPDDFETRRQVLGKMAAQLRIQSEMATGASTDAARATTASALPHPEEMNSAATKAAAQYIAGQAAIAADRGTVADKQRKANGGSSAGLRSVDQQFMADADPNQYIYRDLKPGQEKQDFLRRHFVGADGKLDVEGLKRFKAAGDRLQYHGAQ